MKFTEHYFEESINYADLSRLKGEFTNNKQLGKVPYAVNPSQNDYLQISKHPLATYNFNGNTYHSVRLGIFAGDKDLWMWPGDIIHFLSQKHIAGREVYRPDFNFRYRFQYTMNYPDVFLSDTPRDFLGASNKKALTKLIHSKLGFLGCRGVIAWEDQDKDMSNPDNKEFFALDFSDYISLPFEKTVDDEQEPEYASVIRKFHNMESVKTFDSLLKENEDMNTLDSKFVTRLINYIDKLFPSYGNLDQNISVELKNVMSDSDSKDIQKVKKKIHNILMRCKSKLLTKVKDGVERINIKSKEELSEMPHGVVNNQVIDFKMELPGWNKRMIQLINTSDDVNKLMEPFYDLSYIKLFQKKYALLSSLEKDELIKVLPDKFKQDVGIGE